MCLFVGLLSNVLFAVNAKKISFEAFLEACGDWRCLVWGVCEG